MDINWLATIHHDGSKRYVSNPTPRLNEVVKISLRVRADAPIQKMYLRTAPDGEEALTPMTLAQADSLLQWWEGDLPINEPMTHYRFVILADDGVWFFSGQNVSDDVPLDETDFRILADYQPPAWLSESVFYQIFPDTFAYSGNSRTVDDSHHLYAWGEPIPEGASHFRSYYGGDLPGIVQHLDYLAELGVTAIYLNPVFTASSSHRYNTINYDEVDPFLGGNEALIALRQALEARGMRYILDIVPNHCGKTHPWFIAAQADPTVQEAEFFTFIQHPDKYAYWLNAPALVKLNYQSAELRRRMYQSPDAIMQKWLRPPYSADGWRVDVGNMLGRQGAIQLNREVLQEMRVAVKTARPDAYFMGENFFDASAQLQGDQWDGVMNYQGFSRPLLAWLRGLEIGEAGFQPVITSPVPFSTNALVNSWHTRQAVIPWVITQQQFNLLGSHDTRRLRFILQDNEALLRLATIVQLTFPGVPCIYYGDEIGMMDAQATAPSRGCMIWDTASWNHDLLNFYRDLIALRRNSLILQQGGFQMLAADENIFVYQREGSTDLANPHLVERMIVVAQRSETAHPASYLPVAHGGIPDGTRFVEHFSGQQAVVENGYLPLPEQPQGATLWEEKH